MSVWIELEEGEPIADCGSAGFASSSSPRVPTHSTTASGTNQGENVYLKPSILNRRRRWNDRVRKRGGGLYSPEWEDDWFDDIEMRPRRAMGSLGRYVVT